MAGGCARPHRLFLKKGTQVEARERNRPYTVCLMGASLDGGNLGVCALASSLVRLIRDARPEARLLFFYGERSAGLRRIPTAAGPVPARLLNYRLSPRARWGEHLFILLALALAWRLLPPLRGWLVRRNLRLRALAGADVIGDIHAGDSFSDIYGLRRFLIGVVPDAIALLLGKRLVFLPQTYGPFYSAVSRAVARMLMGRAAALYARDPQSLALVRRMTGEGARRPEPHFCPDVAFALEPLRGDAVTITPPLPEPAGAPLVGLNVSGLLAIGGYSRANMFGLTADYNELIARLIEALLERTEAHLLIVPHVVDDSEESDLPVCRELWRAAAGRHAGRVHLLAGSYGAHQAKEAIGRCDFFIGSRMHACIAALSQGVPALGIAYSEKFQGVFDAAGVGELALDARRLGASEIVARAVAFFEGRANLRAQLQTRADSIRTRLGIIFREELGAAPAPPESMEAAPTFGGA